MHITNNVSNKKSPGIHQDSITNDKKSDHKMIKGTSSVDKSKSLIDNMIISKINVCQPKANGLSHRKRNHQHELDLKSKKSQTGYKFY